MNRSALPLVRGVERIKIHPVLDVAKPFAKAEVISTGKGSLTV
jgi:hypothetical protein